VVSRSNWSEEDAEAGWDVFGTNAASAGSMKKGCND